MYFYIIAVDIMHNLQIIAVLHFSLVYLTLLKGIIFLKIYHFPSNHNNFEEKSETVGNIIINWYLK